MQFAYLRCAPECFTFEIKNLAAKIDDLQKKYSELSLTCPTNQSHKISLEAQKAHTLKQILVSREKQVEVSTKMLNHADLLNKVREGDHLRSEKEADLVIYLTDCLQNDIVPFWDLPVIENREMFLSIMQSFRVSVWGRSEIFCKFACFIMRLSVGGAPRFCIHASFGRIVNCDCCKNAGSINLSPQSKRLVLENRALFCELSMRSFEEARALFDMCSANFGKEPIEKKSHPCRKYIDYGACVFGQDCPFGHPARVKKCKFFPNCRLGDACFYKHE